MLCSWVVDGGGGEDNIGYLLGRGRPRVVVADLGFDKGMGMG